MSSEEQRTESAADVGTGHDADAADDARPAENAEVAGDAGTTGSTESTGATKASDDQDVPEDGSGDNSDTDPAAEPSAEKAAQHETLMRRLVFGSAALAAAAIIAAGVFGVLWWTASSDDNAELASTREEIVRVGSSAVQAFTELDYTKPDEYFDRSAAASTAELAQQINAGREANKKAMVEAKTTATTRVLDLAVAELNEHEGKASFLAAIQVEVKQGEQSSVKPMRVEVQMTRVEEDGNQVWKVSGISQVPVVGAAQ